MDSTKSGMKKKHKKQNIRLCILNSVRQDKTIMYREREIICTAFDLVSQPVPMQADERQSEVRWREAERTNEDLVQRSEAFCQMMSQILDAQLVCTQERSKGLVDLLRDTSSHYALAEGS